MSSRKFPIYPKIALYGPGVYTKSNAKRIGVAYLF